MAQQVRMPRLSQDMTQGRVVEWLRHEGDTVQEGEPLVSIETDKAEVEVQAPQAGVLRRVLAEPGTEVEVGAPLAILGTAEEDIQALLAGRPEPPAKPIPAPSGTPPASAPAAAERPSPPAPGKRQPVSPAARRVARELGVDPSQVTGTGAGGLVTEADVRTAASRQAPVSAEPSGDVEVIPLTPMRRRIAERLAASRRTAADVTTVVDVDMTEVAGSRKGAGVSYTAYVVWATAQALREYPILNASFDGERILVKRDIHLGVAVALQSGLVVPVVRGADRKGVEAISREIEALAERAREGKLGPEALTGSTFTLTNSGAFGSLLFTPIINQPEVAILGMGKVADTPVVREGQIVIRKVMYLCLSYDHRVVDGAPAVQFLQAVKRRLEQPSVASPFRAGAE
jgi:pyruvate/2-oxoglutarate dehydrogenase complex dihydrolipoamide acyltransferase (E2) component